jgi:copper resistance protein D
MDWFLITARAVHFTACVSLTGVFAFECLIARPVLRRVGKFVPASGLERRQLRLAWMSLALVLFSGAAWLDGVAAAMSGDSLRAALRPGVLAVVLDQTRFGEDWLIRLGLALAAGACLVAWGLYGGSLVRWIGFVLAVLVAIALAWAGHGAADTGIDGVIHLGGDMLHLIGAGLWLGTLVPLELLLGEARRAGETHGIAVARAAARRYSVLAVASVTVLLTGGLVNTWFLSGTIPALFGTPYGQLVLLKIVLFATMLLVAAVNLLRLTPRLDGAEPARAIAQLRRNALVETGIGLGVLAVVGVLGILPPGLHTEPLWPLPFRIYPNAVSTGAIVVFAVFATGFVISRSAVRTRASAPVSEPRHLPNDKISPARTYAPIAVWRWLTLLSRHIRRTWNQR